MNDEKEVGFHIEKVGFHFIKVLRLFKQEFGYTFGDVVDGALCYTEHMPFSRAQELKQKFEALGAKVSVKCGNCHTELADGVTFCNKCGTKVKVSESCKCPACGADYAHDAKFCGKCGHGLSVTAEAEKPPETAEEAEEEADVAYDVED